MSEDLYTDSLHALYVRLIHRHVDAPQSLSETEACAYYALRYYNQTFNGGIEQVIANCREEIPAMIPALETAGAAKAARLLRRAARLEWEWERDEERPALSKKSVGIRDALDDASLDGLPEVLEAIVGYVARSPELSACTKPKNPS